MYSIYMPRQLWIAQVLRDAGLTVREAPGWETRGTATFDPVGVMWHHTASGPNWTDQSLTNLLVNGRPDLSGPLCQLQLNRDGSYVVIAAGRANHAGAGAWNGITTGNTSFIGIEAANDGVGEPWPAAQLDAYYRGTAALIRHINGSVENVIGHKEWTTRKIDPRGIDMNDARNTVSSVLRGTYNSTPPARPQVVNPGNSIRPTLRTGSRGQDVVYLQERLNHHGIELRPIDGIFGIMTEQSVRRFQQNKKLSVDGVVGPATWSELNKSARPVIVAPPSSSIKIPPSCSSNIFRRGSRGPCVGIIQRRLNSLGLGAGTPDNSFGPKTEAAVRNFQSQRKLLSDGVVGPKTWSELKK
jgi:peptidoglycan hydrolase-like protein with peptidoglycan-binding domain